MIEKVRKTRKNLNFQQKNELFVRLKAGAKACDLAREFNLAPSALSKMKNQLSSWIF